MASTYIIETASSRVQEFIASGSGDFGETPVEAKYIPTQKKVWEDIQRATTTAQIVRLRMQKALDQEYEPINTPNHWYDGDVEHTCSPINHLSFDDRVVAWLMGLGLVTIGLGMLFVAAVVIAATMIAEETITLVQPVVAWTWVGSIATWAFGAPIVLYFYSYSQECRWFKAPIPSQALQAYIKAKELKIFDRIAVFSPDYDAFWRQAIRHADPLMVGFIDHQAFLICAWDLGQDLKFSKDFYEVQDLTAVITAPRQA